MFPVPNQSIIASISSSDHLPVAGYNYTLICTVVINEGFSNIPGVVWVDSSSRVVVSNGDTAVSEPLTSGNTTSISLTFDPLRTSDGGTYTCVGTISTLALNISFPLTSMASEVINVHLSKLHRYAYTY